MKLNHIQDAQSAIRALIGTEQDPVLRRGLIRADLIVSYALEFKLRVPSIKNAKPDSIGQLVELIVNE